MTRVVNTQVRMMTIQDVLDTIRVFVDPTGTGECRVTITCASSAWTAELPATDHKVIANFFATNNATYLMDSFLDGRQLRADYYEKKRLMQIIMAVQRVFHKELSA